MSKLTRGTILFLLAVGTAIGLVSWRSGQEVASGASISLPAVVSAEAASATPAMADGCTATVTCALDGSILSCNGGFGQVCRTGTSTINVELIRCISRDGVNPPPPLATVKTVSCGGGVLSCPRCPSPF